MTFSNLGLWLLFGFAVLAIVGFCLTAIIVARINADARVQIEQTRRRIEALRRGSYRTAPRTGIDDEERSR